MKNVLVVPLLDKAKLVTGSDYKTAKAMGVSPQTVSDWRNERRPLPPEDTALIAAIAGMDPATWLVRGVLEKHAGTKKGERLANVLGKASLATGAALASVGAHASGAYSDVLRCIERLSYRSTCPAR